MHTHTQKQHAHQKPIHSFHWHVQNVTIPCRSQELLPFLSVMYFLLPSFSTNCSSILSHLILPFISWSTSPSCCSQIHISETHTDRNSKIPTPPSVTFSSSSLFSRPPLCVCFEQSHSWASEQASSRYARHMNRCTTYYTV